MYLTLGVKLPILNLNHEQAEYIRINAKRRNGTIKDRINEFKESLILPKATLLFSANPLVAQ